MNTAGTDENLFRLVPVPRRGAQISARAPTKDYVPTGAHTGHDARACCPGTKPERGLYSSCIPIVLTRLSNREK